MLKKIFAAIIAAQLVIVPVQAETKQPTTCTKGDFVTTFMIIWVVTYIGLTALEAWADVVTKRAAEEKLKAEQLKSEQPAPDCKL